MERVLFVCIGNTCRSQMAEGFARAFGAGIIEVESAGTHAAGYVHPATVRAMAEAGLDIREQESTQLTARLMEWADRVVTLGCAPAREICPASYKGAVEDWPIRDPFGLSPSVMREVRVDIEARVKRLIAEIGRAQGVASADMERLKKT